MDKEAAFQHFLHHRVFRNPEKYPRLQEMLPELRVAFFEVISTSVTQRPHFLAKVAALQSVVHSTGSSKVLDPDLLARVANDWMAFSPPFVTEAAAAAARKSDGAQAKIFDARLREAKISELLNAVYSTVHSVDMSPVEKRQLVQRLAGALGVGYHPQGPSPKVASEAKESKKPQGPSSAYSNEYFRAKAKVQELSARCAAEKKSLGVERLGNDNEVAKAYRLALDAYNKLHAREKAAITGKTQATTKHARPDEATTSEPAAQATMPSAAAAASS